MLDASVSCLLVHHEHSQLTTFCPGCLLPVAQFLIFITRSPLINGLFKRLLFKFPNEWRRGFFFLLPLLLLLALAECWVNCIGVRGCGLDETIYFNFVETCSCQFSAKLVFQCVWHACGRRPLSPGGHGVTDLLMTCRVSCVAIRSAADSWHTFVCFYFSVTEIWKNLPLY